MKSRQIIKRGAVGTAPIGPANLAGISSPAPRSVHSAHKNARKTRKLVSPVLACLAAAILTAFGSGPLRAAPGSGNNPGILPPGSTPGDLSYPDWHVACLNWIMSIAATNNPLLNVDDVADLANPAPHPLWVGPFDASVGQSGNVWFLPGGYATVVREATIPAGKTLVVPLLNHMVWGWPPLPEAEAWMRFYVGLVLDTAEISCEIDGVPVRHIEQYRHQSPAAPVILSDNNMLGMPPGDYGMMVDDGYYLILAPLSVGAHTIHWAASMTVIPYWNPWDPAPVPPFPQGSPEITYHITVVPSQ